MSLNAPRFRKINHGFDCANCGASVPPAGSTCRDHCPFCLWSVHVDVNPGDRSSGCGGLLRPSGYDRHSKKGWMIRYVCTKCGALRTNRFVERDDAAPDQMDALLALTPPEPGTPARPVKS